MNDLGGVLTGVRVLDFGRYIAGPTAPRCWPIWVPT
jgi:hypothetical protein